MSCGDIDLNCRRCRLSEGRRQVVPGTGPCDARIVLVGEAPGEEEDRQGRPFVGRAGRLLDSVLATAGVDRDSVYITNLVKCRPPGNRRPRKDEVSACRNQLLSELDAVDPLVIIALGHTTAASLLGAKGKMSDLAGRVMTVDLGSKSRRAVVAYHPAACLYQRKNIGSLERSIKKALAMATRRSI